MSECTKEQIEAAIRITKEDDRPWMAAGILLKLYESAQSEIEALKAELKEWKSYANDRVMNERVLEERIKALEAECKELKSARELIRTGLSAQYNKELAEQRNALAAQNVAMREALEQIPCLTCYQKGFIESDTGQYTCSACSGDGYFRDPILCNKALSQPLPAFAERVRWAFEVVEAAKTVSKDCAEGGEYPIQDCHFQLKNLLAAEPVKE